MRKTTLLTLSALLLKYTLMAQADFKPGYIIKHSNDTIHGFVGYLGSKSNSMKCPFKETEGGNAKVYTPDEIKAYRFVNDAYYVSSDIGEWPLEKHVFLEYLINGTVDIYYYKDNEENQYFVDGGDGKYRRLKNSKREIRDNGNTYIKESKEYVGVLKNIFLDSPATMKKVEGISLNQKDLIRISQDYHNEVCSSESCVVYKDKDEKFNPTVGVFVGTFFYKPSYQETAVARLDPLVRDLENPSFSPLQGTSFGFYLKSPVPYVNQRVFAQLDLLYSRVNETQSFSRFERLTNRDVDDEVTLDFNSIAFSLEVKYEFLSGRIRPYLLGGYTFESQQNSSYRHEKFSTNNNVRVTGGTFNVRIDRSFHHLFFGVGANFKWSERRELFLETRYRGNVLNELEWLDIQVLQFNLGFRL